MLSVVGLNEKHGSKFHDLGRQATVVAQSKDAEGAAAFDELGSADCRTMAINFATPNLGRCGIGKCSSPYPVNASGEPLIMPGEPAYAYRMDIEVNSQQV